MRFNVTRIVPNGFIHHMGFAEVQDSLAWALSSLGHEVTTTFNWLSESRETNIVFGAELIADWQKLPRNTIVYNLEQPSHPNMDKVRRLCQGLKVWDYSAKSTEDWKGLGFDAVHVPIGYTPNLTRIPKTENQDIDVLFVGWLTPRRVAIIEELKRYGLRVVCSATCYGGGRDNLISRAKVVLNVHHDGRDRFEIIRCSFYMANYKMVVSEFSSDDDEYSDLHNGLARTDYRALASLCLSYCSSSHERYMVSLQAFHAITSRPFSSFVERALDEPPLPQMSRPMEFKIKQAERRQSFMNEARELYNQKRVEDRFHSAKNYGDMKDFVQWMSDHAEGNILEIGVRDGASTSAFLHGLQQKEGHLYSVDIEACGHLFSGHPQWTFIQADSKDIQGVIKKLPPIFDLILIDGDHTLSGVTNDWEYVRLLKPGGMVLFHDIKPEPKPSGCLDPTWPNDDVKNFYFGQCEALAAEGWTHEEPPGRYGLGVLRKPVLVAK